MIIGPENDRHIYAEKGMVFRRIADQMIYGNEIYLGYTYYIGGVLQDPPHYDVYEDFEEIEDPNPEPIKDEKEGDGEEVAAEEPVVASTPAPKKSKKKTE